MTAEALLAKIRKSLRVTHSYLDDDIQDLIDAVLIDLKIGGGINLPTDDALILRAITIYCKANFGLENADSEKYQTAYNSLKVQILLSGDYNVVQ